MWAYLQNYSAKHKAAGNGFGFGLVGPDDTCRTLSARYYKDGSEILVDQGPGKNPRRLTPRECARLMGLPDSFRIPVSDTQAYKQFGNSVAVPVFAEVARIMRPHILAQSFRARESQRSADMPDVHDPKTRSRNMAAIRGKDTKPEILIRKELHQAGFQIPATRQKAPRPPGYRIAAI